MPPLPSGRRLLAFQRSSRLLGVDGGTFFVEAPKGLKMRCWHLPFNIFAWQPEYPARNARNVSILLTSASNAQEAPTRKGHLGLPTRHAPTCHLDQGKRRLLPIHPSTQWLDRRLCLVHARLIGEFVLPEPGYGKSSLIERAIL